MPTRRQEKVARVVTRAVSAAILQDLSDPRIRGIVSVTRVEMSADLRNAEVYLSIMGDKPAAAQRTFEAIQHGRRHIQMRVADEVRSKFCPILHFHQDDKFKKNLDVMNLIDEAASEYRDKDVESSETNPSEEYLAPPSAHPDESRDPL
ncbi:30S ribosome-binding factor RbfA [Planctomycetota bacterium]